MFDIGVLCLSMIDIKILNDSIAFVIMSLNNTLFLKRRFFFSYCIGDIFNTSRNIPLNHEIFMDSS